MIDNKEKSIDFLDVLLVLVTHKKFIILSVLVISIIAVVYSFITPQYWRSSATILPAEEKKTSLPFESSLMGLGSAVLGSSFKLQGIDLVTIMKSRSFTDDIIKKYDLIEYFKIKHLDSLVVWQKARKKFNKEVKHINLDEETGLITITIETKDKYLSTNIANYYCNKLEEYNLENRMSKGKQKRIFIEQRINEVRKSIDSLSQVLNDFQKKNSTINIEEQTKALITLYSDLVAQKIQSEIELEYQRTFLEENSPTVTKLRNKLQLLNNQIKNIESSKDIQISKYTLEIDNIPNITQQYSTILLDLEIQTKLYEFLYPLYEDAKIEEIKDLPTIEIVDKAVPSGLRFRPKRARFCIIVFFLALIISSILIYTHHILQITGRDKKIKLFWILFFGKK